MRFSKYYIPTLKEAPTEAEIISHKLLIRAGMIRKLSSGIYTWLPLGLRTLNKAIACVRREMNRAEAMEVLMPMVQNAELWQESGRWQFYGKELLRFKDRNDRDFCLGPTHEEVVTDLVRGEVRSYKQLPINLYQIQTKYRDEIRPRFGLMRGREFLMKDAYSFDANDEGADKSYHLMREAYNRIFNALALNFRMVEADSGSIGGSFSHEFMVLAETGEDLIAACADYPNCSWASNTERAVVYKDLNRVELPTCLPYEQVSTPNQHSVEEVSAFLKIDSKQVVKTLLYMVDNKAVAALVRGDRELNEVKLKNYLGASEIRLATFAEVEEITKAKVGYAGPVNLGIVIYADNELLLANDYVAGANIADTHILHLDLKRDCKIEAFTDLRMITLSDPCPVCGSKIELKRGIEVGHIFKLGTKYSKSMNAVFLDEHGKENSMIMGCYGIGVSRVVAACIEQNNDDNGIVFPPPLAPYDVELINLDQNNVENMQKAEELYNIMSNLNLEILHDERDERPGIKFKDADLIGIPMQVIVGAKSLARGVVEAKNRKNGEKIEINVNNFQAEFQTFYNQMLQSWGIGE